MKLSLTMTLLPACLEAFPSALLACLPSLINSLVVVVLTFNFSLCVCICVRVCLKCVCRAAFTGNRMLLALWECWETNSRVLGEQQACSIPQPPLHPLLYIILVPAHWILHAILIHSKPATTQSIHYKLRFDQPRASDHLCYWWLQYSSLQYENQK